MSDAPRQPRSISDISHLFLGAVRDRATPGTSGRPVRTPPGAPRPAAQGAHELTTPTTHVEVDLDGVIADEPANVPPVTAIIASHLSNRRGECVRAYARNLAAGGQRIGLLEIDAVDFALTTFEPGPPEDIRGDVETSARFDSRAIADAIAELNCDIDRWIISPMNTRLAEARALLRQVDHWVVLSSCDHDTVVSAYRTLKGLADLHRPRLSLSAVDAGDGAHARALFDKLAGVCDQFLHWRLEPEPAASSTGVAAEHRVLDCHFGHDKSQLATAAHWNVVNDLCAAAKRCATRVPPSDAIGREEEAAFFANLTQPQPQSQAPAPADNVASTQPSQAAPAPQAARLTLTDAAPPSEPDRAFSPANDVIDLGETSADSESTVIDAVMRHCIGQLLECPVRPPMLESSRLAVTRDHRLVLVALAGSGLKRLREVGNAYRWLNENRSLVAMAMPQLAIDAHQSPHLRLLIDQADLTADVLRPLFQVTTVTIQSLRRLRWGQRQGLLLDAA